MNDSYTHPPKYSYHANYALRHSKNLSNDSFLFGNIIRRSAIRKLSRATLSWKNPYAAHQIALLIGNTPYDTLQKKALKILIEIKDKKCRNAIWEAWTETRNSTLEEILVTYHKPATSPPKTKILSLLLLNDIEKLQNAAPKEIQTIINAFEDQNKNISNRARLALSNLKKKSAKDELCSIWFLTRSKELETIIQNIKHIASKPTLVHLATSMKFNKLENGYTVTPQGIEAFLELCTDTDEIIKNNALNCLHKLKNPKSRVELCKFVIQKDHELAKKIAQKANYTPEKPDQKAYFYFMLEKWEQYQKIDFDQRIMRAFYHASSNDQRKRIARKVQKAGNPAYLTILAGIDFQSLNEQISYEEAEILIDMLSKDQEWQKIWKLAFELPAIWSVRCITLLSQNNWSPENKANLPFYQTLIDLAYAPMVLEPEKLKQLIPLAVQRSNLKVRGRINDVSFSPKNQLLAIGTGEKHVILWDYQKAKVENTYKNFDHSIAQITFTQDGDLVVGERSNTDVPCGIYFLSNKSSIKIGQHTSAITSLEPAGQSKIFSSGRDQLISLYDIKQQKLLANTSFYDWGRSACISPDFQHAALINDRPTLFSIPTLNRVMIHAIYHKGTAVDKSVARSSIFLPSGSDLIVGQNNGQVVHYQNLFTDQRVYRETILENRNAAVEGLDYLEEQNILMIAFSNGTIQYMDWPKQTLLGTLNHKEGRLTSLHISPDGNFMATGTSDATMRLWDIRTYTLPDLLQKPISQATPNDLSAIQTLLEEPGLEKQVYNTLLFLKNLLQFRFRFDIIVSETPSIQIGEFDIVID